MKKAVVYIHGKGGCAAEAEHYRPLFPGSDVIGFDYHADTPWAAKTEFPLFFAALRGQYDAVILIANSIGAYFSMHALAAFRFERVFLISPVVAMERLILNMMNMAGVTEDELRAKKEIPTDFGEMLSWEYLTYVRSHPLCWNAPTCILYGGTDQLTDRVTVTGFADSISAELTVMENGEHWFHTEEQMQFLDDWISGTVRSENG